MSRFNSFFTHARATLLGHHGEADVTYIDTEGTDTAVTAILGPIQEDMEQEDDGQTKVYRRSIVVATDTAANGVENPGRGGRFTVGEDTWYVEGIESQSGGLATLRAVRHVKVEIAGRGNRAPR